VLQIMEMDVSSNPLHIRLLSKQTVMLSAYPLTQLIQQLRLPLSTLNQWKKMASNPTLKFAPFGRWDTPSARPLATH